MGKRNKSDGSLVEDLILACTGGTVTSRTAQQAIRALCRYCGGLLVYIPARKDDGRSAEKLRGVIADAVGDAAADEIVGKIMRLYGNMSVYIPMENNAFRTVIALEIFERYDKGTVSMDDLAREYRISFSQAFRLWKIGRHEKLKPSMPYLPFLELAESNQANTPQHK